MKFVLRINVTGTELQDGMTDEGDCSNWIEGDGLYSEFYSSLDNPSRVLVAKLCGKECKSLSHASCCFTVLRQAVKR
jgi:hypothetical protein